MAYYNSLALAEQAKRGEWDFKLRPVYNICFTNFMVYPDIRKLRVDSCQCDTETGKPLSDLQRYIYIQLPIMTAQTPEECDGKFEEWIYTLKNIENMKEIPFALRDEAFRRLSEVGSLAALSPEEKRNYDEDQKRYWILTSIEKTRYDEGIEKGIEKGIENVARNMIQKGFSDESILLATGLTPEQLSLLHS